jgi:hypothetical protein
MLLPGFTGTKIVNKYDYSLRITSMITLPHIDATPVNSFTVELWFKFTTFPTGTFTLVGMCSNPASNCA